MLPQRAKGGGREVEARQRQRIELQRVQRGNLKWAALGECVCVCVRDCMCAEGFFKLMIN